MLSGTGDKWQECNALDTFCRVHRCVVLIKMYRFQVVTAKNTVTVVAEVNGMAGQASVDVLC